MVGKEVPAEALGNIPNSDLAAGSCVATAGGRGQDLAILVECQSRDLLRMAKPVPLGARMQVLHYH